MPNRSRIPEVHFYEWRIAAWLSSSAHDEMDATGRGIYREMIDTCYAKGQVTSDPDILCRKCACTKEELSARWEAIRKHFLQHKKHPTMLMNPLANIFRREYFHYKSQQKRNAKSGGTKKVPRKSSVIKQQESDGLAIAEPPLKTKQEKSSGFAVALPLLKTKQDKTEKSGNLPDVGLNEYGFASSGEGIYEWFCKNFIGAIPEDLWQNFSSWVDTDSVALLYENLPLWMKTVKYQGGYGKDAHVFLKSGVWKKPPSTELMGKQVSKSINDKIHDQMSRL